MFVCCTHYVSEACRLSYCVHCYIGLVSRILFHVCSLFYVQLHPGILPWFPEPVHYWLSYSCGKCAESGFNICLNNVTVKRNEWFIPFVLFSCGVSTSPEQTTSIKRDYAVLFLFMLSAFGSPPGFRVPQRYSLALSRLDIVPLEEVCKIGDRMSLSSL